MTIDPKKIERFFQVYAEDLDAVRAAQSAQMTRDEYNELLKDPRFPEWVSKARGVVADRLNTERETGVVLDPANITRETLNKKIVSLIDGLESGDLAPAAASAANNLVTTLAKVNGLAATEVNVNISGKPSELTTEKLEQLLAEHMRKTSLDGTAIVVAQLPPTFDAIDVTESTEPTQAESESQSDDAS